MDFQEVTVHPTAEVSPLATLGPGTRIWHHCHIRERASIGRNCNLGKDVYVDFGVEIGDDVKIQNGAFIYHGTTIEAGVFIGPGAIFTNDHRPRAINKDGTLKGNDDWEVGRICIRYGASIGAGAIILPNVTIGRFSLVGAGALVTRDVPDHALVVGQPARQVGHVCRCAATLLEEGPGRFHCPDCHEWYQFS